MSVPTFNGYTSKTFSFKSTDEGDIHAEVFYPEKQDASPATVLIHYHGGFLVVGDRLAFYPYWLANACVSRNWIFVSPDYRLLPEATAHNAVEDAVDAYEWVRSELPALLGRSLGSVLAAGSSAGSYLALATATIAVHKPAKLLLVYGMLDAAGPRYTTPGTNIAGRPAIETAAILEEWPLRKGKDDRRMISAYTLLPQDMPTDRRFKLVDALHVDALFPDYMTGVEGLGRAIASQGIEAVPEEHRRLFPLSFADLTGMPPTMLLHGLNDSAVPVENSRVAEETLRSTGTIVFSEFPEDAEHGFDVRAGKLNVEASGVCNVTALGSLRRAIRFLDGSIAREE